MPDPSLKNDGTIPGRLQKAFQDLPGDKHNLTWSSLWDEGGAELWDRGRPSPALVDLVEGRKDLLSPRRHDGSRKTALVPGCGRGYDVVLLALHGFDAYGLEVSTTAVEASRIYAKKELERPSEENFGAINEDERKKLGECRGCAKVFFGDFFESRWNSEGFEDQLPEKWDLVYDYTFFCALPPDKRKVWAKRMAQIICPGGLLVCLEFPLYKDPSSAGPPWGVRGGVYWDVLVRGGNGILDSEISQEEQNEYVNLDGGDFTRELYIKPKRSYDAGRGTDMVSIWARK